jgi:hypothetical protein
MTRAGLGPLMESGKKEREEHMKKKGSKKPKGGKKGCK